MLTSGLGLCNPTTNVDRCTTCLMNLFLSLNQAFLISDSLSAGKILLVLGLVYCQIHSDDCIPAPRTDPTISHHHNYAGTMAETVSRWSLRTTDIRTQLSWSSTWIQLKKRGMTQQDIEKIFPGYTNISGGRALEFQEMWPFQPKTRISYVGGYWSIVAPALCEAEPQCRIIRGECSRLSWHQQDQ